MLGALFFLFYLGILKENALAFLIDTRLATAQFESRKLPARRVAVLLVVFGLRQTFILLLAGVSLLLLALSKILLKLRRSFGASGFGSVACLGS